MTDGDFGFDLGFRLDVINSVEQQNLALASRGAVPMPRRPVLSIVQEFVDEKIGRAVQDHDPVQVVLGLSELKVVLRGLVLIGRKEFKADIKRIDVEMVRIVRTCRKALVRAWLDPATPREDLDGIRDTLIEIIERGAWPGWKQEVERWGRPDDRARA
jgi:hypothetical protein